MTEDKSTRYHRLKRRSEVASLLWSAAALLLIVVSGLSVALAGWAQSLAPPWLASGIVVAALLAATEIAGLPLAWYGGHVLERRYGLARQTVGGWLLDHLKATALGLLLAWGAVVLVYGAMRVIRLYPPENEAVRNALGNKQRA